jgi:hypothetical protein
MRTTALSAVAGAALLAGCQPSVAATTTTVPVRVGGGHATDPRDHGRPVVLVAAGLGVPSDVFRRAFSGVTPAAAGQEPEPGQVDRNKQALLDVLRPYGVTNDELDRVSNHYRYNGSAGETWAATPAVLRATVRDGKVVSVRVLSGGAGYSSRPTLTVPGHPSARLQATVAYDRELSRNGRIARVAILQG